MGGAYDYCQCQGKPRNGLLSLSFCCPARSSSTVVFLPTFGQSKASIKDILHFRQAVAMMDDTYPFTPAFGPAKTRAMCLESSEKLFEMLQAKTPDTSPLLPFETLSEIAFDANGQLVREKAKALIRLFRPDRKGFLTKLDFVSSTDDVYKELRLFRESLARTLLLLVLGTHFSLRISSALIQEPALPTLPPSTTPSRPSSTLCSTSW